jgi:hypothetical protein
MRQPCPITTWPRGTAFMGGDRPATTVKPNADGARLASDPPHQEGRGADRAAWLRVGRCARVCVKLHAFACAQRRANPAISAGQSPPAMTAEARTEAPPHPIARDPARKTPGLHPVSGRIAGAPGDHGADGRNEETHADSQQCGLCKGSIRHSLCCTPGGMRGPHAPVRTAPPHLQFALMRSSAFLRRICALPRAPLEIGSNGGRPHHVICHERIHAPYRHTARRATSAGTAAGLPRGCKAVEWGCGRACSAAHPQESGDKGCCSDGWKYVLLQCGPKSLSVSSRRRYPCPYRSPLGPEADICPAIAPRTLHAAEEKLWSRIAPDPSKMI